MKLGLVDALAVLAAASSAMGVDIVNQPTLTLEGAKRVADAAIDAGAPPSATVPPSAAAQAGIPVTKVTHLSAAIVAKSFAVGSSGATLVTGPGFTVNASRRDGAGQAEVHVSNTDIFYVLEGSATLVTGGQVVQPHEQSPGEIRGTAIEGGDELQIGKGDVLTIPNGVPHWFKVVRTPFRYYVVKSSAAQPCQSGER